MPKSLLVDITAHGLGHLSQTVPVIEKLRQKKADLRFIVRSGISPEILIERLGDDIIVIPSETDFGCVMKTPFEVDPEATLERYLFVESHLEQTVAEISGLIRKFDCSGVISNISYPALLAAKQRSVPSVAFSSLIWSEVAAHYIGSMGKDAERTLGVIRSAYKSASAILKLDPGMPMLDYVSVPIECPIAQSGVANGSELRRLLGVGADCAIVLCAFGGQLPKRPQNLKCVENVILIGPMSWSPNVIPIDSIGWKMADLIASSDAVLTKPGYGIVAEMGCSGTPGIFISRGDWPEEPYLLSWFGKICAYEKLNSLDDLSTQTIGKLLRHLNKAPHNLRPKEFGDQIVANFLDDKFFGPNTLNAM